MSKQVVVFRCQHEEYAVPIEEVVSIEKIENITPIPHLPNYLIGFTRIRDEIIPIIDFSMILYNTKTVDDVARIIVLNTDVVNYGLVVSEAKEIINVRDEELKQVGLINYDKTRYFTEVAYIQDRIITCVEPKVLVSSLEGIREIIEYLQEMINNEEK